MNKHDKNTDAFFALLRAGLWETEARLRQFEAIDYSAILRLAEEQSVVGLVAAGLEHVAENKPPKDEVIKFISRTMKLEQRNMAMNQFIGGLVRDMRDAGLEPLLVKGQGVAQCYERPSWRSCGDVDLLVDQTIYKKAKDYLSQRASFVDEESPYNLHLGMTINSWVVELHGTLRSGLGKRIDKEIDSIQEDTFKDGQTRVWRNGETDILLPAPDNDAIFIFTHILQHFFKGGIGIRQICDCCRLLWTYREMIDTVLLEKRLRKMSLISEWKAFAALAVDYLGMPAEAMPLYSPERNWSYKASRIMSFVLQTGNFGHNRDKSYYEKYPVVVYKAISFWNNTSDSLRHFVIFPKDATRVWFMRLIGGFKQLIEKGK